MDHRFESQETSHPSCTVTSAQAEVSSLTSLSLFPHLENGGCELAPSIPQDPLTVSETIRLFLRLTLTHTKSDISLPGFPQWKKSKLSSEFSKQIWNQGIRQGERSWKVGPSF